MAQGQVTMASTARDLQHSVWEVYDLLRTARLNTCYYSWHLTFYERAQVAMQIVLAAAVPSSAIAGFNIWSFGLGEYAWGIFAVFASGVAFVQPFLGLPKKIKKYDTLVTGYTTLFYDLKVLNSTIENDRTYDKRHSKTLLASIDRQKRLELAQIAESLNQRRLGKCPKAVPAQV